MRFQEQSMGGGSPLFRTYSIIRENIKDFTPSSPRFDAQALTRYQIKSLWRIAMDKFKTQAQESPENLVRWIQNQDWDASFTQAMLEIALISKTLSENYGLTISDLKDDNIGILENGKLTIRDYGDSTSPEWATNKVKTLDIPHITDLTPRLLVSGEEISRNAM